MKSKIVGNSMQALVLNLEKGEKVYAEAGSMMYMNSAIKINSEMKGGLIKSLGRKIFSKESLFMSTFEAIDETAEVGFAAPYPGTMKEISFNNTALICQKDAYVASVGDINLSITLTKRLGFGFFGGEGFILQKIEGSGVAFIHAGGNFVELDLGENEEIRVDTGCLVAFDPTVQYSIRFTGNLKTSIFGGEGLFLAHMKGPGKVYLQTLPFARMANEIIAASGMRGKGETTGVAGFGGSIAKSIISG